MPLPRLGSLESLPALAHPELLAPSVHRALSEWPYADQLAVVEIDPALADTVAMSEAYAIPLEASANCVVVAGRPPPGTRSAVPGP